MIQEELPPYQLNKSLSISIPTRRNYTIFLLYSKWPYGIMGNQNEKEFL
jgi:hypothetical protein